MTTTINSKTPEEIKRGLELCIGNSDLSEDYCEKCPYIPDASCRDTLEIDALAYIQRLEHSWDELFETAKQLERERDEARKDLDTINYANTELHSAYEAMKRERDAAVDGLARYARCVDCKRWNYVVYNHTTCEGCENGSNWQWRGVPLEEE